MESSFDVAGVETSLAILDRAMAACDFRSALKELEKLEKRRFFDWVHRLPPSDRLRAKSATLAAELYFYHGENKKAQALLAEYATRPELLWAMGEDVTPRAKLQVAEYFYSRREFGRAVEIGEEILSQCKKENDPWGIGESCYYLLRFCSRREQFDQAEQYGDQALASFAQAGMAYDEEPIGIRWRIGLVLLVAGHAKWRAGYLGKAMSKLQVAQLLLKKAEGDPIGKANVKHSIGAILRSKGEYEKALRLLEQAHKLYRAAKHQLNISRVQLAIGRVHLDVGNWNDAKKYFEEALEIAGKIENPRQKAEILICMSWLYLEDANSDWPMAERYAQEAIKLSVRSAMNLIEAKIALGHYRLRQRDYKKAQDNFEQALVRANELGIAKLQVNAYLSLAELYCDQPVSNLRSAEYHYEQAKNILTQDFSHYLRKKAERVRRDINSISSQSKLFVVTVDDIASNQGLKELTVRLQRWAVEKAIEAAGGKKSRAAKKLKLSRQSLDKTLKRLNNTHGTHR